MIQKALALRCLSSFVAIRLLDDHKSKFWEQMNYMKLGQDFPARFANPPN
jgi:hypothetical protein